MIKQIIMLIITILVLAFVCTMIVSQEPLWQVVRILAVALIGISLKHLFDLFKTKGFSIKKWYQSKFKFSETDIRLSFSYLYKIQVDGKYLLVRGNRMKDRYQPIGGVYKFYPEARNFLNTIHFEPDTKMKNFDETDDLRIKIKGKYLLDFYEWFFSMKDREYDPTREFYEEVLKDDKLLPESLFRHLNYRKIGTHDVGVKWSEPLRINEVVYADIFEVTLNDAQKEAVRQAVKLHPDMLILASAEEMECRRYGGSVEVNLGSNVP